MDVMGDKTTLFETGRFVQPSGEEATPDESRDETADAVETGEAVEEMRLRLPRGDGEGVRDVAPAARGGSRRCRGHERPRGHAAAPWRPRRSRAPSAYRHRGR